ncbi:MAG TPA: VWA domain-containing protein [Dehalococcoidia bacterium]
MARSLTVRLLIAGVCAAALASSAVTHAQETLHAEVVHVSDGAFPNANAIVNVEDTSGGTLQIGTENFAITVDGVAAPVSNAELATSEDAPLDVVFAIDTSGSMQGAPLANAKTAAKSFSNDLGVNDRVAIISFGDDVTLVQDFTTDRAASSAAIDSLVARGNTALYQATTVAAVKAGSSFASRRAVILLSDGADFGGRSIATRDEAVFAATSAAVPFFAIAQGTDLDRAYLQQVAEVSKGRYLEAPKPQDLESLYASIGRLLRSQYVVTFDASGAVGKPAATVKVTLTAGDRVAVSENVFRPLPNFAPGIQITGVTPGEVLTSRRALSLSIPGSPAANAIWFVDDRAIVESSAPPWTFDYDPARFGEGQHTLKVSVQLGAATIETGVVPFRSTPPPSAGGGGLPLVPIVAIAIVLIAIGAGAFAFLRARAGREPAGIPFDQRTVPWVSQLAASRKELPDSEPPTELPVVVEEIGEPKGVLVSRGGVDLGAEYLVGATPVSIGSGAACAVRIDDPELSGVEARIWVRGGHLMLHRMTRLSAIAADGTTGGWTILEENDQFDIGGHRYEFHVVAADFVPADRPPAAEEPGEVANILRDSPNAPTMADEPVRLSDFMPRDAGGLMPPRDGS